jgi:hypothetical protein
MTAKPPSLGHLDCDPVEYRILQAREEVRERLGFVVTTAENMLRQLDDFRIIDAKGIIDCKTALNVCSRNVAQLGVLKWVQGHPKIKVER